MREIPVKGRNGEALMALVDAEDFPLVSKYKWCVGGKTVKGREWGYAYASAKNSRKSLLMHRLIMNPQDGICVDHINGNRLDNRKANLRLCNRSENMRNRGPNRGRKYKGVYRASKNRFRALICVNHKLMHVGTFSSEEEAAKAYDEAAIKLHGEFVCLNFPDEKNLPTECNFYNRVERVT